MSEPTITCPNCKSQNKLTESLATQLIQAIRVQCEQRLAHKESDVAKREAAILRQQSELAKAKAGIEQRVAEARAELLRRRCELDDEKRGMNLTIETKVQESLAAVREKARHEAEDALKVEIIETNELIASLKLQLEEKEGLIATMQRQMAEKNEQIATMQGQVAEKNGVIASMQRQGEIERQRIAAEEVEKARLLMATDLEG